MKGAIFGYFVFAVLFGFVIVVADLNLPWTGAAGSPGQQRRIDDALILTESALGGAAGVWAGLAVSGRLASQEDAHLQRAVIVMAVQNAIGYLLAVGLTFRISRAASARRERFGRSAPAAAVRRPPRAGAAPVSSDPVDESAAAWREASA